VASDEFLRTSALRALAKIGDGSAADAIFGVGKTDNSFSVRVAAAEALVSLEDSRVREVLIDVVQEAPWDQRWPRKWAVTKLTELGATEAIPVIESAATRASGLERLRMRRAVRRLNRQESSSPPDHSPD
jgi:HEAT repeat protein